MFKFTSGPKTYPIILTSILTAGLIGLIWQWMTPSYAHPIEPFPWGLLEALNICCGLAVTAGSFSIASALWVSRLGAFKPALRHILLLGYLSYLVAIVAACIQYGVRTPILLQLWSPKSFRAGIAVALPLYSLVVWIEFLPRRYFASRRHLSYESVRYVGVLLVCLAAVLAAVQQVSSVDLLRVATKQFSPIWVTAMLPVHLYCSSLCGALALLLFAYWRTTVVRGGTESRACFTDLARAFLILLFVTGTVRLLDITDTRQWSNLLQSRLYDYLFGLELVLYVAPIIFLLGRHMSDYVLIYDCSIIGIAGLVVNRLNTVITAREVIVGSAFVPRLSEFVVAIAIIAAAVAAFARASKQLLVYA